MNISDKQFKQKPKDWRNRRIESIDNGALFTYGCPQLLEEYETIQNKLVKFEKEGKKRNIDRNFMKHQYDLDVELWINYEDYAPYFRNYIPREEFFWNAASLRWPTLETPTGRLKGVMVRTPWSERIVWAFANFENIALVGGAGIGKTLTPLAVYLMCWDHFIATPEGARVCFTSTSEKKLLSASWSNLMTLQAATKNDISEYAGKGLVRHSIQIKKNAMSGISEMGHDRSLYDKDHKAIMTGQTLGGTDISPTKAAEQVDKLTGSHVEEFIGFLLDEYQSMGTAAPLSAVKNLKTHVKRSWTTCSGNLSMPDDALGQIVEPTAGFKSIDVINDDDWIGYDPRGMEWYVCHFNNDKSPGMKDPIKYHFMPTQKKRDDTYKKSERDGIEYYRFWLGGFQPEMLSDSIIPEDLLEFTQANEVAEFDPAHPVVTFFSFDSAPSSLDRSIATECQIGCLKDVDRWCLNFVKPHRMKKTAAASFLRKTGKEFNELMKLRKVASGDIILDDTGSTGMQEQLMTAHGMMARGVKYNSAATNGKIDYSTDKTAKDQCINLRAEMALLLQRFIENGMVRGLTEDFCDNLRKEICSMRWKPNGSKDRKQVEDKGEFKQRIGFSPDIFDTCMMAALHARDYHGLVPGYNIQSTVHHREEETDYMEMNSIYDHELY